MILHIFTNSQLRKGMTMNHPIRQPITKAKIPTMAPEPFELRPLSLDMIIIEMFFEFLQIHEYRL